MKTRGGGFFDTFKNMFKSEKPRNITRKVVKGVEKSKKFVTDMKDGKIREAFLRAVVYLSKKYKKEIESIASLQTTVSDKIYKLYRILKKKLLHSRMTLSRNRNKYLGGSPVSFALRLLYMIARALGNLVIVIIYICVALICFAFDVLQMVGSGGGSIIYVGGSIILGLLKSGGGSKTCCERMKEFIMTPYYPFNTMREELNKTSVIRNVAEKVDDDNGNNKLADVLGIDNSSSSESEESKHDDDNEVDNRVVGVKSLKCDEIVVICDHIKNKIMNVVVERDESTKSNLNNEVIDYINHVNGIHNKKLPEFILECKQKSDVIKNSIEKDYESYYGAFIDYNQDLDGSVKNILDAMREGAGSKVPFNGLAKESHHLPSTSPKKHNHEKSESTHVKTPFISRFPKTSSSNNPKISTSPFLAKTQIPTIPEVFSPKGKAANMCKNVYSTCKTIRDALLNTSNLQENKNLIDGAIYEYNKLHEKDLDMAILECRKENEEKFNALEVRDTSSDEKKAYRESVNAVILAMSNNKLIQTTISFKIRSKETIESINNYLLRTTGISFEKFKQLFGLPTQSIERGADLRLSSGEDDDVHDLIENVNTPIDTKRLACIALLDAITDLYKNIYQVYAPSKFYKGLFYYDVNKTKIKALFLENYTIEAIIKLHNKLQDETLISCISPTYDTYTNVCYISDFLKRWNPTEEDYSALNIAIERNKEDMKDLQNLILKKKPQFKNPIVSPRGLGYGFFGGKTKRSKKQYKTKSTIKRR